MMMKMKALTFVALTATLAGLVAMAGAARGEEHSPKCKDGTEPAKVTTGIAQLIGCWNKKSVNGADVYTAPFDSQPAYGEGQKEVRGVDMNGFLVGAWGKDQALQVNTKEQTVRSVSTTDGSKAEIGLYSQGWPDPKNPVLMGGAGFVLNFTAPNHGDILIEDFRLGSNAIWSKVFDGFSPIGDVETPAKISEGGTGSMDFTVQLAGIFTLKGRPQSVTIKIPTTSGEGSKIDGFNIHLQELDGIKLIKISDFEAEYSAAEKKLGGGADFSLPFMGGKGISFSFEVEDKVLTKASVGASGIKVPIGAPPAGFITALSGGFGFSSVNDEFVLNLNAGATAEFGPEVPTPWGKVVPLEVSSALKIGKEKQDFYFLFDGGVKVFRLPVGSVYLKIHTNSGVAFGFNIGVGFPSYSNNPNDPFYIGAKVDGWVAKQKFQFEGRGKVRLIGLDIFDGRIMINNRAAGACWKVTWFDGGAVYEYGRKDVQTFGVGCGLDRYKEKYPTATRNGVAAVSAARPRKLTTGPREVVLSARGQGDAPRFKLVATDGRVFEVPRGRDIIRTPKYMIVVDRANKVTHVAAGRLARGDWKIVPFEGSAPIMGARTGKVLPAERVNAEIRGSGLSRTLVWDSVGNPNTKLAFTEVTRNGNEQPILVTDKVRGSYSFNALKGGEYGKRRLRAYVIHGGTPREVTVEDRYIVRRPALLKAPRIVRAWRNGYTAAATWQRVPGARGYVAEIAIKRNGKRTSSYRRVIGPKHHKIAIPSHPGGGWAVANVQALNPDGVPGRIGTRRFRLSPPDDVSLATAGRQSAASATRQGGKVKVRVVCPVNGHCQTRIKLKVDNQVVGQAGFQQVPDTYRFVELVPKSAKLRRRLASVSLRRIRVVVRQHRNGNPVDSAMRPVDGR